MSNNSIKFLTSLKSKISQKTFTVDDRFELVDRQQIKAFLNFDMDAQLGEAWQVLHKKLEPLEKIWPQYGKTHTNFQEKMRYDNIQ